MTHSSPSETSEMESLEQAAQPLLCAKGCGFFSNPACQGMCSKCYRELTGGQEAALQQSKKAAAALAEVQRPQAPAAQPVAVSVPQPAQPLPTPEAEQPAEDPPSSSSPAAAAAAAEPSAPEKPEQKNHSRCFTCNKRVGLTGFRCRCEYTFCGAHRLAEAHDCSFDYKTTQRQRLAQNNPLISADKLQRRV